MKNAYFHSLEFESFYYQIRNGKYDLTELKTKKRELSALEEAGEELKCENKKIITMENLGDFLTLDSLSKGAQLPSSFWSPPRHSGAIPSRRESDRIFLSKFTFTGVPLAKLIFVFLSLRGSRLAGDEAIFLLREFYRSVSFFPLCCVTIFFVCNSKFDFVT